MVDPSSIAALATLGTTGASLLGGLWGAEWKRGNAAKNSGEWCGRHGCGTNALEEPHEHGNKHLSKIQFGG